jgi:hypothetical protein
MWKPECGMRNVELFNFEFRNSGIGEFRDLGIDEKEYNPKRAKKSSNSIV